MEIQLSPLEQALTGMDEQPHIDDVLDAWSQRRQEYAECERRLETGDYRHHLEMTKLVGVRHVLERRVGVLDSILTEAANSSIYRS